MHQPLWHKKFERDAIERISPISFFPGKAHCQTLIGVGEARSSSRCCYRLILHESIHCSYYHCRPSLVMSTNGQLPDSLTGYPVVFPPLSDKKMPSINTSQLLDLQVDDVSTRQTTTTHPENTWKTPPQDRYESLNFCEKKPPVEQRKSSAAAAVFVLQPTARRPPVLLAPVEGAPFLPDSPFCQSSAIFGRCR
jgi:hypothetical protein